MLRFGPNNPLQELIGRAWPCKADEFSGIVWVFDTMQQFQVQGRCTLWYRGLALEGKALLEDSMMHVIIIFVATLRPGGRKKTFGMHGRQGIARISDACHTAVDVATEQGCGKNLRLALEVRL